MTSQRGASGRHDPTTAIPLWAAFMLARRKPSASFTYGYGRVEDLAGIATATISTIAGCGG
jgi:divalent metal cation (Fe/Co/Zn/Cd) transporter